VSLDGFEIREPNACSQMRVRIISSSTYSAPYNDGTLKDQDSGSESLTPARTQRACGGERHMRSIRQ
jgi:hypothetical protein